MIQSRIREIRKDKGLTLQEVADRAGTTAQTIGRLETGMRTLSLKWVSRIARALGVDPALLLALPEKGDLEIEGQINSNGKITKGSFGTLGTRFFARLPLCFQATGNFSSYKKGDILIFDGFEKDLCLGKECFVTLKDGNGYFARVLKGANPGTHTLVLAGDEPEILENVAVAATAPLVALVRKFN